MKHLLLSLLVVAFAATATAQTATITPGNNNTNNDGVTAINNTGSGGNITMNPENGPADPSTQVEFKNNSSGSVSGLDDNDSVTVAHGATANVTSNNGGTVDYGSGGSGTVTNSAPPGPLSKSIKVIVAGRPTFLAPGSTWTIPAP